MQAKIKDRQVISELRRIMSEHHGMLFAEDVVREARADSSPLHKYFQWDDSSAAEAWRLQQARQLIGVCVEIIGDGEGAKEVDVFVSLREDRGDKGGYRELVTVLSNPSNRANLLRDALDEMIHFREKYQTLTQLADVFQAMDKVGRTLSKVPARARRKSAS